MDLLTSENILSLSELRGRPFPVFKVKTLTVETMISQYVTPGIIRVLQNSPELKKLIIVVQEELNDQYMDSHGLLPNQCWRLKEREFENIFRWNLEPKHMASFMELMLKTTKTLEKMVTRLVGLLQMVPRLSHDNNVSIVLSSTKSN
ncbi:hypothetical protein EUTSA_v10017536mg [Eutrema salsugineum]|uniref:FBD domain-containing protein n=1 Tax=Eutrema salsugineum TaxID=72664 RepID=V4LQ71_EUTSA|nr:hypothetical protein EUTSA_v10017536mg [Eutrema salsugineum]